MTIPRPSIASVAAALAAATLLCGGCGVVGGSSNADFRPGFRLVAEHTFPTADTSAWEFTDESAWIIGPGIDGLSLNLIGPSAYEPPVRSPLSIAWLRTHELAEPFIITADVQYTGRDYGHADLCFFFNGLAPDRFYYAHIAHEADPHANSIFLVDGAPRRSIAAERSDGQPWGTETRRVRIERYPDGRIQVYLDSERIMYAVDTTLFGGRVGFGSFDDTGRFDNIRIYEYQERPGR